MTRKQALTKEAAAWRKLAEWCVKHYGFVCTETEAWSRGWSIPPFEAPWASMHDKVSSMANASCEPPGGMWNTTALASPMANEDARVIFCLLMALECEQGYSQYVKDTMLAALPLPKVTRFRTFTVAWGGGPPDTYRVNGRQVEWYDEDDRKWERSRSVSDMARHMAEAGDWTALAALADVAARPTEEVDA